MTDKNTKKSPIHENADENITCEFGDISRSRSRFTHTSTHGQAHTRTGASQLASSIIVRWLSEGSLISTSVLRNEGECMESMDHGHVT